MIIRHLPAPLVGATPRSLPVPLWRWLTILLILLLVGCASTQQRGDRAFRSGNYQEALDHYERSIDQGSRDPELYFNAAQAATRIGDFTLAERYYSQSLRYGGDEKVARSLAEFYIATSNYTKAVRVLQQLLDSTDQPQSVFNNLGTALMYAGAPLDAESYLLIAQQMDPSDPVPYVNLGVLYDKHLNQPRMALGFYTCYLSLVKEGTQRRKFAARVESLRARYSEEFGRPFGVRCGEPYRPSQTPSAAELKKELAAGEAAEAAEAAGPAEAGEPQKPAAEADEQPSEPAEEKPVIQRQVEEPTSNSAEAMAMARRAWGEQNYRAVVNYLEDVPAADLDAEFMGLYGRSLARLGRDAEAERWLSWAVDQEQTPDNVSALLGVYQRLEKTAAVEQLCDRLAGTEGLDEALEQCSDPQP